MHGFAGRLVLAVVLVMVTVMMATTTVTTLNNTAVAVVVVVVVFVVVVGAAQPVLWIAQRVSNRIDELRRLRCRASSGVLAHGRGVGGDQSARRRHANCWLAVAQGEQKRAKSACAARAGPRQNGNERGFAKSRKNKQKTN